MAISTVKITVGGVEHDAVYNSTGGYWVCQLTAPALSSHGLTGGYYPVTVSAEDDAGNTATADDSHETLGNYLRLSVYETVAPVISGLTPSSGSYIAANTAAVSFSVTDNDSGVDLDTLSLTFDGVAVAAADIVKTQITGGWYCEYTPPGTLSEGPHAVVVGVSDNDGNDASASSTFYVDTAAPTLLLGSPTDNALTNQVPLTFTGMASDASGFPDISVTVNGVAVSVSPTVTNAVTGAFELPLTLGEGTNVVVITATDSAGHTSSVTRTVVIDITPPVISAVEITPGETEVGGSCTVRVTVSDP